MRYKETYYYSNIRFVFSLQSYEIDVKRYEKVVTLVQSNIKDAFGLYFYICVPVQYLWILVSYLSEIKIQIIDREILIFPDTIKKEKVKKTDYRRFISPNILLVDRSVS